MMPIFLLALQQIERSTSVVPGIVVPAAVLTVSFVTTWLLYRHFSRQE
jgi:high-affinity Fe2+/Pb2+ permease